MPQNKMTEIRSFKHLTYYCAETWGNVHFMEYKTPNGVQAKTYTDLKVSADAVSLFLERNGLAGSHVALIGGASFKWVAAFMGIVNSGSVAVPLAPAETDDMNTKLIDFSDSTVFVFDEKHLALYEQVRRDVPSVKTFISVDDTGVDGVLNISDIIADNVGVYKKEPDGDDLCAIMFTSGTTGFPKGVMLTHRNFIATGVYIHDSYPTPRMLGVLPYHHAFGLTGNITKIMVYGRTLCLCDNLQNVFADFKLYKPNGMLAVPQMIKFISFVILGLCVVVAALIKVSRLSTINYSVIAKDIEMDAILAVALGGNALSGGKFNMWASVLGAYVIQFLTTTLYKFNVQSDALAAYKAVVVILLVFFSAPKVREYLSAFAKRFSSKSKKRESKGEA